MSFPDRAIIFAAGKGSRLGPYTGELPKTLLTVGNLTIFDRIIANLDRMDVKDIVVVTGHAGSRLRQHAISQSSKIARNKLQFEFIVNNDLDIGNIYSFWLARSKMLKDFLLFNSDVVFDHRILDLLRNDDNRSTLVIDDSKALGKEEMKVKIEKGGVIKEITKYCDPSIADGEYIGIMKVSDEVAKKVTSKIEQLLSQRQSPLYYEDAFRLVAKEQDCLFACSTTGLPWAVIDTIYDINYARSIIVPHIENLI